MENAAREKLAAETSQGDELSPVGEHVGVPDERWQFGQHK